MIRTGRFLISQRPYAVNLDALKAERDEFFNLQMEKVVRWRIWAPAVWFRRRQGVTMACLGYLWDSQEKEPRSPQEALERYTDGRYGGHCHARLDATGYWSESPASPERISHDLAILKQMLENYPAIPDGYDGWWRF